MAKFSINLCDKTEELLKQYMDNNNIKFKRDAIERCILAVASEEEHQSNIDEIDKKLNRILYRLSINTKLLEQSFVNMGFQFNEEVKQDSLLQEFYDKNNKYKKGVY